MDAEAAALVASFRPSKYASHRPYDAGPAAGQIDPNVPEGHVSIILPGESFAKYRETPATPPMAPGEEHTEPQAASPSRMSVQDHEQAQQLHHESAHEHDSAPTHEPVHESARDSIHDSANAHEAAAPVPAAAPPPVREFRPSSHRSEPHSDSRSFSSGLEPLPGEIALEIFAPRCTRRRTPRATGISRGARGTYLDRDRRCSRGRFASERSRKYLSPSGAFARSLARCFRRPRITRNARGRRIARTRIGARRPCSSRTNRRGSSHTRRTRRRSANRRGRSRRAGTQLRGRRRIPRGRSSASEQATPNRRKQKKNSSRKKRPTRKPKECSLRHKKASIMRANMPTTRTRR